MEQNINYRVGPIVTIEWGQAGVSKSRLIFDATNGDAPARKELLERVWGKVKESLDVTSGGETLAALIKTMDDGA